MLVDAGATVTCYDPVATEEAQKELNGVDVTYASSMHQAIDAATIVMLVTSWPEFLKLPTLIAPRAHQPLVIDGRRMLDADSVTHYEGIGRGEQSPDVIDTVHGAHEEEQVSSAA